jgi:mRNA-degrading endonuclease RelE of RelBE toxin-antitoxin system
VKVLMTDEAAGQYGAKALSGPLAGRYRMRTGDYRVQFRLEGGALVVEKVGHRDRFYEGG